MTRQQSSSTGRWATEGSAFLRICISVGSGSHPSFQATRTCSAVKTSVLESTVFDLFLILIPGWMIRIDRILLRGGTEQSSVSRWSGPIVVNFRLFYFQKAAIISGSVPRRSCHASHANSPHQGTDLEETTKPHNTIPRGPALSRSSITVIGHGSWSGLAFQYR
jgi:hypothetical protein